MQPVALVLAASSGGSPVGLLLPVLLLVAFFFFIVRPQRARQRQFASTQASLTEGQEVVTTAGLYGTLAEVAPDFVLLEVAPGVRVKLARAAVASVLPVGEPVTDVPPDDQP